MRVDISYLAGWCEDFWHHCLIQPSQEIFFDHPLYVTNGIYIEYFTVLTIWHEGPTGYLTKDCHI